MSGPLFPSPSKGWIGCWFLQAPRAVILFNEREKLGEKTSLRRNWVWPILRQVFFYPGDTRLDYQPLFWKWARAPLLPPNSGNRAYDNLGFGIRDSRYWITDSFSAELGFLISIVIQIPKPRIPDSRSKTFPDSKVQIFLHRATLKRFLSFFYTTTKNTKNHLSIQGVTFLAISISRDSVAKKLLMWAFTTLPPIHMRW